MMVKFYMVVFLTIFLIQKSVLAQSNNIGLSKGPENGTLVIIGGGRLDSTIYNRVIELAGGSDAKFVFIPTAGGDSYLNSERFEEQAIKEFRTDGFKNVTILHTRDREKANLEEFVKPLKEANGVWFGGGRQWRLVDAYQNTLVQKELENLLTRGGVIAGTSAGATIQGSFLARGDTKTNTIMVGDHLEGFGFISNIAIDQHILPRNRHFDMFKILKEYPELLGIGIDESTALVVQGDKFEVIGKSFVSIYDGTIWSDDNSVLSELPKGSEKFYFLAKGMRYNLALRCVIQLQQNALERIFNEHGIYSTLTEYEKIKNNTDQYYENEFTLNWIGYKLLEVNRYEEAIKYLKLNVNKYPDFWNVYDSLGEAYMKAGNKELAIKNYEKSIELNPNNNSGKDQLNKLHK